MSNLKIKSIFLMNQPIYLNPINKIHYRDKNSNLNYKNIKNTNITYNSVNEYQPNHNRYFKIPMLKH
jgi:hypothetical protein